MTRQIVIPLLLLAVLLAGCSTASPTPIPTLALNTPSAIGGTQIPSASGGISASAEIAPAQSVDLSFSALGMVVENKVSEGDEVRAGEVLASLDNLAQLQSALDAAQQNLASAQKGYDQLVADAPVVRANAELTQVQAQKALDDAQKAVQSKQFQRATQQTIDIARANLIVAQKSLEDAETIYNQNKSRSSTDVVFAAALSQLAAAQQRQQQAQSNLNYVSALPDPTDIEIANANLDVAKANLAAANITWDQVKDGPNDQATAAAKAQIATAQANQAAAQSALERAVIKAPFDGTVISVEANPGQAVNPGQVVLTLADLKSFQVETTDLSERDVNRVHLNQAATVTVPGMGKDLTGKVVRIAPRATKVGGDVVYKVTIQLDGQPAGLRWGMSATVQFGS